MNSKEYFPVLIMEKYNVMPLLTFNICVNILTIDKVLTGEKKIIVNNTEKQSSSYREIESEAAFLFKGVSNSYSEALDALKSELPNT